MSAFIKTTPFRDPVSGRTSHVFLNLATGAEIEYCNDFILSRVRLNKPANSIAAWIDDLKCFFNYFFAASDCLVTLPNLTATALAEIITAYPLYLAEATFSSNVLAREAAKICGASPLNPRSAKRRISTVKSFLKESQKYHSELVAASELGLIDFDVAPNNFFKDLNSRKTASDRDRQLLRQHSIIGGLIKGGARYVEGDNFRALRAVSPSDKRLDDDGDLVCKAFPANSILELLQKADNHRDRALWSLMAGTGIRTHEALQVLFSDVNPIEGTVKILPYQLRINEYRGLDVERASNKGRATEDVYFLSPFKEIFFDSLEEFMKIRPQTSHNFLFVNLSNNSYGAPMWQGKANGRNAAFKSVQELMGIKDPKPMHSLRHFYGVWVLNFVPHEHGYGFDLATVQIMMGHISASSTEKYAIRDRHLVSSMMSEANRYMASASFDFSKIKTEAIQHASRSVQFFLGAA